jgi:signal transduction histidine kinase
MVAEGTFRLDLVVEQALFRVAQEALANVARHSQAGHVEVILSRPGDDVLLEVKDDGRGFAPASALGRGMGLRSMRERMAALGGELAVDSKPGEGTRILARCKAAPESQGGNGP